MLFQVLIAIVSFAPPAQAAKPMAIDRVSQCDGAVYYVDHQKSKVNVRIQDENEGRVLKRRESLQWLKTSGMDTSNNDRATSIVIVRKHIKKASKLLMAGKDRKALAVLNKIDQVCDTGSGEGERIFRMLTKR
jgi:hypothetical protein